MLYDDAQNFLGWPARAQVFDPKGAGARVYAEEVKRKIRAELRRQFPNLSVEAGVLAADPNSDSTEAPIAIVCEFSNGASDEALKLAHRLAWNFSRAALLITLEPHRLLAWSCWLDPQQESESLHVTELRELPKVRGGALNDLQASARDLLHWVSLITGDYLKQNPKSFPSDGRADAMLLDNLRVVRRELLSLGLVREYCHDLLARIIFAQFLFHRKDSDGRLFLAPKLLDDRCEGTLRDVHRNLGTILADGDETYRFFRWLDGRFNGDLFPGKENQSDFEREDAWRLEKEAVTRNPAVLQRLAQFVSGRLQLRKRQLTLWPLYSFDTIPLEFISSVYEEFLTEDKDKAKAYYTPPHLVDFVLDGVLPWNDDNYDLKILDPCCGSGIFLVKAFQRLIYRWRRKHGRDPLVSDLKPLLASNLWGVDRDPEAVRVACFSLYLTMADAIDPKYYLMRDKVFPRLRGVRLLARDFFDESTDGIRSTQDAGTFDLVIGNAPWGRRSIRDTSEAAEPSDPRSLTLLHNESDSPSGVDKVTKAERWAQKYEWPVAYLDIGPLFLAKGGMLAKLGGRVSMAQPASTLLYQRASGALALRRKIFATFTVEEIANLSALRRQLFEKAIGPACVITLSTHQPAPDSVVSYICPKPQHDSGTDRELTIEPQDVHEITHVEAANDPFVWSALAIGGRRDLELVRRLNRTHTSLAKLEQNDLLETGEGISWGNRERRAEWMESRHILATEDFPTDAFMSIKAQSLPVNLETTAQWPRRESLFSPLQLLIKATWTVGQQRFKAALIDPDRAGRGALCTQAYVSVHAARGSAPALRSAWLTYNSRFAVYYLLLTSSRLGHFIPEPLVEEILSVPLPAQSPNILEGVQTLEDVDKRIFEQLGLNPAERCLVDDLLDTTFQDIVAGMNSAGRQSTHRASSSESLTTDGLTAYAECFARVLKTTFGADKDIAASVFVESGGERLPVRLAAIHLGWPGRRPLAMEPMEKNGLLEKLQQLYQEALSRKGRSTTGKGLGFQRVAFLFASHAENGYRVPSLYIIKPDQRRYWTRSLAMRDADELVAKVLLQVTRAGKGGS